MTKRFLMGLATCLLLTGQAWAGPVDTASSSSAKTPIIDVVAMVPAPADPARLLASPDLRLDPATAQAHYLARKAEAGQGKDPAAVKAGPLSAQFQSVNDSVLDRHLEAMRQPGASGPLAYKYDPLAAEQEAQGGFLALNWKASTSSGITLGGGYVRSSNTNSGGSSSNQSSGAVRGGGALSSTSARAADGGTVNTESVGRWGAFLAVPYQLGKNVGLRPEVTYYHGDTPDAGRDAANEWVMGLRFTFGF